MNTKTNREDMNGSIIPNIEEIFAGDVISGLSSFPKTLPSRYFYDEKGSRIFEEIMKIPEYYLTNCEWEIFRNHKQDILELLKGRKFQLVDLGAGDAQKSKVLIGHFYREGEDFQYIPIDINGGVIEELKVSLASEFPGLETIPIAAEYFDALQWIRENHKLPKLVMFMGSNIGNFSKTRSREFLTEMHHALNPNDLLLIGIDLIKDPQVILAAYDDKQGVTARFNLNLLERINRELDADFDLSLWKHYCNYNPVTGAMESYLISQQSQEVFVRSINTKFSFDAWEPIHTEYSYKYTLKEISALAEGSGFELLENFLSSGNRFADTVWRVK